MAATRDDWKTTPLPAQRQEITLERVYSADEFERIRKGTIPAAMEDKWFMYYDVPWLFVHRSWTGVCVFQVRFDGAGGAAHVVEALVNRDDAEYHSTGDAADARLLGALLDGHARGATRE